FRGIWNSAGVLAATANELRFGASTEEENQGKGPYPAANELSGRKRRHIISPSRKNLLSI
ncbi:MAG TPA: hypothetical protein VK138_08940, partial [Acidiferrobacterales bacterium]|nr:hypothetical protein [Acidiferrobacterales bacterium]